MHSAEKSMLANGSFPVFVFPDALHMYAGKPKTYKQKLTLYNPFKIALDYEVFSTAPFDFIVTHPVGSLSAESSIDIFVRHVAVRPSNYGRTKLRIKLVGPGKFLSTRDLIVTLHDKNTPEPSTPPTDNENFEQLLPRPSSRNRAQKYTPESSTKGGPSLIVILAAFICVIALMFPTVGHDHQSSLPSYLHVTFHQKLIFAYTLGLVTMVILRP